MATVMKLNQGLVLAAALVVGSLAVTGCSTKDDEDAAGAATEQASVAADEGASQAVAANEGFTQDARFHHRRPGQHNAQRAAFRRGERDGFRRGERDGFRRGERREGWRHAGQRSDGRRAWWRFW
jgi:hypothetical protein